MILELKDICKDYIQGKMVIPVLKHVDFQMEAGEYVAIMGPSGSGKTTLMNIVGCLDQATSGNLILDGQDISKCTENEMSDLRLKKIGFVFQNFSTSPKADGIGKCGTSSDLCRRAQKGEKRESFGSFNSCGIGRESEFSAKSIVRRSETASGYCKSNCK